MSNHTPRVRAAQHGVSMEEEARRILNSALGCCTRYPALLGSHLRDRFRNLGDEAFVLPKR